MRYSICRLQRVTGEVFISHQTYSKEEAQKIIEEHKDSSIFIYSMVPATGKNEEREEK